MKEDGLKEQFTPYYRSESGGGEYWMVVHGLCALVQGDLLF